MLGLIDKLQTREVQSNPIKVGVIGTGYMGSGVINAIQQTQGMKTAAVWGENGREQTETIIENYHLQGVSISESIDELCCQRDIDVVVDAVSSPLIGAEAAIKAIKNRKHLVSINIECDVTIGNRLKEMADKKGVVYTVIAGDEPGELKILYDHYTLLGFRIIALGKGKNNPLQCEATPESTAKNLPDNGITAQQVASFIDGSKTMFEMVCVSNATGLIPDKRGMHGPVAKIEELGRIYTTKDKGGILEKEGVVDYVTGSELSGGVFIVVTTDNRRIREDFKYLKIGIGENYGFYQRYHNWFIDTPLSIARAVFYNEGVIASLPQKSSEVAAVAKRNIKAGEKFDGIGGYTAYGEIEIAKTAEEEGYLPHGLTEICIAKRNLKKGVSIRTDDVEIASDSYLTKIWKGEEG